MKRQTYIVAGHELQLRKRLTAIKMNCEECIMQPKEQAVDEEELLATEVNKMLAIICFVFLFCVIIGIITALIYSSIDRKYQPENISIKVEEEEIKHRVYVIDILKEAGKEDIYVLGLGNIGGTQPYGEPMELPESVYKAKIGEKNNVLTRTNYTLTIVYPLTTSLNVDNFFLFGLFDKRYMVKSFEQSDFYDESPFTYENSKELIKETLIEFQDRLENSNDLVDATFLSGNQESYVDWLTLYLQENSF
ncbi:hypothetical protein U6B65_14700 (plasmid) [Oscillospiraceae bacterium MB08-C2-2]|nr:hypothetical protein U6B65_14700 [Oscillospiraceae bacterium MB08-C2-2]